MNCGIIAVVMGIILSIMGYIFEHVVLKCMIGKNLSITGRGLVVELSCDSLKIFMIAWWPHPTLHRRVIAISVLLCWKSFIWLPINAIHQKP